jgi:hypothetical protein
MMPTPFVLNDAVVIKQKIIPGQITRYSARYSKPTFTKKHVQFSKKVIKGKDNTKFPKICEAAAPIIQKNKKNNNCK